MNCDSLTKRENTIVGVSQKFIDELKDSLPAGLELVVALESNGNVVILAPPNTRFVETNPCDGTCSIIDVPSDPCGNTGREIVGEEIPKHPTHCDSDVVSEFTQNNVVAEVNSIGYVRYHNSGCLCTGGGCMHW